MRSQEGDVLVKSSLTRREHIILALVFVGALGVRGVYLWGQARNNPLFDHPMMDGMFHHRWAEQIASGEGMGDRPYFRAPLYYYLLAALYKVFGASPVLGRVAGCVVGAATCYLIARLGVLLGGYRAGVVAGVLAAVYWPLIYFDGELLTVGLENLLDVGLLLLLVMAGRRRGSVLLVVCGIVWGLSAITRPTILTFALGIVAWFWISSPADRRLFHALRGVGLTCAGAALVILPVTVRNYVVGKEFVLIAANGGVNFYIGNNPNSDGISAVVPGTRKSWMGGFDDTHRIAEHALGRRLSEGEVSGFWYAKTFEWIRSEPLAWSRLMLRKFGLFWRPDEIPNNQPILPTVRLSGVSVLFWVGFPLVACLGVGGVVLVHKQWRTWFVPISFGAIYMATVVAFFCNARYRLPVVPVLILLAAAGMLRFAELARRREFKPIAASLAVMAAVAAGLVSNLPDRGFSRNHTEAQWHTVLGAYYATPAPRGPEDWAKAAEHFAKAVKLEPWRVEPRLGLGRSLVRLNKLEEASRQFALAVRKSPNHAEARLHYGLAMTAARKFDRAIEQYKAAIAIRPSYAEAHQNLGCLLVRLGRDTEAMKHLRNALTLAPNLAQAQKCLETSLKRQGQPAGPTR